MGGGCCVGDNFIVNAVKDFFCSDSCCVGNAPGPRESEIHAKKVADELAEMKVKNDEAARKQERSIIENINRSMNSFMREVEGLNRNLYSGKSLDINTNLINKKNDELKEQVIGCVGNVMNKRLVQTDKELSIILEERDDAKRKENFEGFINKVKKEALDEFKKQVESTIQQQSKMISKEINIRLKEVNKSMEESISALTDIMESKQKSGYELEKIQIDYMYESSLCGLLLDEVES